MQSTSKPAIRYNPVVIRVLYIQWNLYTVVPCVWRGLIFTYKNAKFSAKDKPTIVLIVLHVQVMTHILHYHHCYIQWAAC